MIIENYRLNDFRGRQVFRETLAAAVAAARLPALLATSTSGETVALYLDTDRPLSTPQRVALNTVVAALDSPADELATTKRDLGGIVRTHARTLRQAAGKTVADVDATRDATEAAIGAAATADEANAIALAYTGRSIK